MSSDRWHQLRERDGSNGSVSPQMRAAKEWCRGNGEPEMKIDQFRLWSAPYVRRITSA
jgi:hypothetical protein